jgi:hypothetical protein
LYCLAHGCGFGFNGWIRIKRPDPDSKAGSRFNGRIQIQWPDPDSESGSRGKRKKKIKVNNPLFVKEFSFQLEKIWIELKWWIRIAVNPGPQPCIKTAQSFLQPCGHDTPESFNLTRKSNS